MDVQIEERSATERGLVIRIPAHRLTARIEEAIEKVRRKARLPGFRPGKVPRAEILKRHGQDLRAEALDELLRQSLGDACRKNGILPVSPADIEDLQAPEDGDVLVRAVVEVDPVLDIRGWQDLGIRVPPSDVHATEVDHRLEELRQKLAEVREVGRASATGDLVTARYLRVVVSGEERPVGENPVFQAFLGRGQPEVDRALTGVVTGAQVEVDVSFPPGHSDPDLAGRKVHYQVEVMRIDERDVPVWTDELAARFGVSNLDELMLRVRQDLESHRAEEVLEQAREQAVDALLARNPFSVPEARIRGWIAWQHERLGQMGVQVPSLEKMMSDARAPAERAVRRDLALQAIARAESIQASTQEVEERIRFMAHRMGRDPREVRDALHSRGALHEVREDLTRSKVLDKILGRT